MSYLWCLFAEIIALQFATYSISLNWSVTRFELRDSTLAGITFFLHEIKKNVVDEQDFVLLERCPFYNILWRRVEEVVLLIEMKCFFFFCKKKYKYFVKKNENKNEFYAQLLSYHCVENLMTTIIYLYTKGFRMK